MESEEKVTLLSIEEQLEAATPVAGNEHFWRSIRLVSSTVLLGALLCLSALCNFYLVFFATEKKNPQFGLSRFADLESNFPTTYEVFTDWWGPNERLSNALWEGIDTSPICVALTDDWALSRGLPIAGRFPWDDSKGVYFLKSFHDLHCLKLMRRMVVDLRHQGESQIAWEHYEHCLDALRQDIMCRADDTPLYGNPEGSVGDGQTVQCRDWNKLIAWAKAPERNACYNSLGDYRSVKHSLEKHAFCPPDSPYYDVSRRYFEKWGHRDPFVE